MQHNGRKEGGKEEKRTKELCHGTTELDLFRFVHSKPRALIIVEVGQHFVTARHRRGKAPLLGSCPVSTGNSDRPKSGFMCFGYKRIELDLPMRKRRNFWFEGLNLLGPARCWQRCRGTGKI